MMINVVKWLSVRNANAFRAFAMRAVSTHQQNTTHREFNSKLSSHEAEKLKKQVDKSKIKIPDTRSFTQLSKNQPINESNAFLKPELPINEQKHVPIECDPKDIKNDGKSYKLQLDLRSFEPQDIEIVINGCNATVKGSHIGTVADGSKSKQDFEYVFTMPENADCDRLRAFFNMDNGQLCVEAPFQGESDVKHTDAKHLIEMHVEKMAVTLPEFDPDAPIEQKVPTPGEDEFPRDVPEEDHQVFDNGKPL